MASTQEKLYVTYVDVDRDLLKVWGQKNRIGATYIERQLLQLLPEFNKSLGPDPERIHKGMFCFAKYTDDSYYRARIISSVQDGSVGVLFVDYGNRDIIKLSNIRILERHEGDVLAKMSEQADEYYLAQVAAPPSGWSIDIVSEIRREICYDEFHYQVVVQVGDQKILNILFRGEDLSSYLVKKQLARPLLLPAQKEMVLSYCSLVSNGAKIEESSMDSPRLPFSQSLPPNLRQAQGLASPVCGINMQSDYAKANESAHLPSTSPLVHYPSRYPRTSFHQNNQNIPKDTYYTPTPVNQINSHMSNDSCLVQPMNPGLNPLVNHQLSQFYQAQANAAPVTKINSNNKNQNNNSSIIRRDGSSDNNNNNYKNSTSGNLIELIAEQVKQYIAKEKGKCEAEVENVPHHYMNTVLEVGSTYNAVVSHIDDGPWSFSIQLLPSEEELKKLMKDLSSAELIPMKPPIILGCPCIGRSVLHESLCRGVVVSISRSAVKVYFVDFGNTEDLSSSSIYELPARFFKVSVLSQKFSLSGLQKVAYCDDIKKSFEEVVKDQLLVLRVDSLEGDNLPTCELYIKRKNIKRILNEKMRELRSSVMDNILSIGDTENVLVTWVVSPQKFFVQMKKRDVDLIALEEELTEMGTKGESVTYAELNVGFKCICLFESDGHWYRVVITSIDSENTVSVFYVDYGNTETVELSLLRKVDGPCLINRMGNQAIECCLKGFENEPFDQELANRLETLILEKELQMTVVSMDKRLPCVNLYDKGTEVAALLFRQTYPTANESGTPDIESRWDCPKSEKTVVPNFFEKDNGSRANNLPGRKDTNFYPNKVRSKEWESGDEEPAFQGNNWSGEEVFGRRSSRKTERNREFGNWGSSKPAGERRGRSRGRKEPAEGGWEFGKSRSRSRSGKTDYKSNAHVDKRFSDGRGKRFDDDQKGDAEGNRFESMRSSRFGDRNKSGERQLSRVPIKREDIAPPGSKFEERFIDIGSCLRGIITYYFGPDEFFVQLLSDESSFKEMMKDIQAYYSDKYSIRDPVNAGDIVMAQFSVDKVLYRAEVIKPSPVTVRYVDYGNQEPVQPKGIWFVDKKFLQLPQQVVACRLAGLQPIGSHWPPPGSALDKFFAASEYKCTFIGKEGGIYEISMESAESGKDVADEIIAAGLGRPKEFDIPETDYSLLPNQILRLYVSHVESSSEFYVVINQDSNALIAKMISTKCKERKSFSSEEWSSLAPDTHCLANLDGDSWCRGIIKEADDTNVKIWFCDRGDTAVRPKEKVSHLPHFLKACQPQVAQCRLHWNSNVKDEENFKNVVEGRSLLVHVMSAAGNGLSVTLYDEEGRLFDFEKDSGAVGAIEPIAQFPVLNRQLLLAVSHVATLRDVYVQSVAERKKLAGFQEDLNKFYSLEGGECFQSEIVEGTLVVADSLARGSWCRGRVLSFYATEVEVFYIDYGFTEVLPQDKIKKLDSSFFGASAFCRKLAFDLDCSVDEEKIKQEVSALCENRDLPGRLRNDNGDILVDFLVDGKSVAESLSTFKDVEVEALVEVAESDRDGCSRVFVSHIDRPDRFWVHEEASINELQQFQDELQNSCETCWEKPHVELNDVVATKFSGMWYRARVTNIEGKNTTVQFIDYGNALTIDLSTETVKELTPDIVNVPVFAKCFALRGTWGEGSTSKFEEIILRNDDPVSVTVVDAQADPVVVDLFQNGESIAEMLKDSEAQADGLCSVYISHSVSPDDFYVQRETSMRALDMLMERLGDVSHLENAVSIEEKEMYAAKYPEDGAWYRARVTNKTEDTVTVLFVDYGNTCVADELKRLPQDVVQVPALSEHCCLAREKNHESWPKSVCDKFAEYADGRALDMRVIASAEDKSIVELFYENKNIGRELEAACAEEATVEMYVSHAVSPREFYVQYVDDEEYRSIEKAMSEEGEALAGRREGMLCQARFEEDGLWYRAKILRDLGAEGCEVFFMDFGNTSLSKELRKLPKNIEDIPPRAFKCSLDLEGETIPESAEREFVELTCGGAAVFRGRILTPGETNIITLQLDGRVLEEILNIVPEGRRSLVENHVANEEAFDDDLTGTEMSSEPRSEGKDDENENAEAEEVSTVSRDLENNISGDFVEGQNGETFVGDGRPNEEMTNVAGARVP